MPPTRPDPARRFAQKWFGALVAFQALSLFTTWAEISRPWPKILGFPFMLVSCGAEALLLVAGLAMLGVVLVAVFALFSANTRKLLGPSLAFAAALAGTSIPTQLAARGIWSAGIEELARTGEPLVEAIRRHEAQKGKPPASLEALNVDIPSTPCGCSPYRYELDRHANPWTLSVIPPFRGVGFNRFAYWPRGNYPLHDESGSYERVGEWALCHEAN